VGLCRANKSYHSHICGAAEHENAPEDTRVGHE
jgi:hypothetical protein